jgi:hypothetical protein
VSSRLDTLLSPRLRAAALMPAALLTVHQLRYLLAFGDGTGQELEEQGHQYLGALAVPIAMSVAIVAGLFLARLASAWRDGAEEHGPRRSFLRLALTVGAAILAIYSCQELLEGLLSSGHPGGFDGVFGDGGWWSVPLSLACGIVIAAALQGARAAIRWAAARHRRPDASYGRPSPAPRPRRLALPRPVPLAGAAAGRAPPPALRIL